MATIRITDEASLELETGATGLGSTFEKYLKGRPLHLVAAHNAAQFFRQSIDAPAARTLSAGFSFKDKIDLGASGAALSLKAGAPVTLRLVTAEDGQIVKDDWFSTIEVPVGSTYVSVAFAPTLGATLSTARGPLGFGFTAGTSIGVMYAEPFRSSAGATVGKCCRELLERHGLPGDVDDLVRLPVGAFSSVASEGTLTISSKFTLEASPNPLASVSLPVGGAALAATAGASVAASFQGSIKGAFEIRVWKSAVDTVRLGYFRRKDASWSADVTAQVGVTAEVGGRDVLALLLGAVFGKPKADVATLLNGGLTPEQIATIQALAQASVNRTLTLSLNAAFSSLRRDDAAFEYEITPGALTAAGKAAVEAALDGDLSQLQALEHALGDAAGIAVRKSLQVRLQQRKTVLKLNLFGLVNATSVEEFLRESRVAFDEDSGGLVLADTVSSKRLGLVAKASRVESERLRKVLLESVIATASYRAGRLTNNAVVDISQQYFEFHRETRQETMRDNLEGLVALGLITPDEMEAALRPSLDEYGPSTFLLETGLSTEVCRDLFLTPAGEARPVAEYEVLGREALLAFVPPRSHDEFRRIGSANPGLFNKLKAAGSNTNMHVVLSPIVGSDSRAAVMKAVIASDVVRIVWWAESMHKVGRALADIVSFLAGRDPADVKDDKTFVKRRRGLEDALAEMVKHSESKFGDPWGLVAMDLAANRHGSARAIVAAPTLTIQKTR